MNSFFTSQHCVFPRKAGAALGLVVLAAGGGLNARTALPAPAGQTAVRAHADASEVAVGTYRLHLSDSVALTFPFSPEYNQDLTVQPDGTVALKEANPIHAAGLTLEELDNRVVQAYQGILRDPKVSATLKDFQRPSFYASGEVNHPGRYELRIHTFLLEALAEAGGVSQDRAKRTQIVIFRPQGNGIYASHTVDIKAYLHTNQSFEDFPIQPGDVIYVPQNKFSKFARFLPSASVAAYAPGF